MLKFLGRPPRVSQRFVHLEVPMYLTDGEMELPPAELEALIARKGNDVWDIDSIADVSTNVHVNKNCFVLREEVLELFLGTSQSIAKDGLEGTIAYVRSGLRGKFPADKRPSEVSSSGHKLSGTVGRKSFDMKRQFGSLQGQRYVSVS